MKMKLYLREIKKDITYFRTSYQRANLQVDISGLNADQAARKVKEAIEELDGKLMQQARSEQWHEDGRAISCGFDGQWLLPLKWLLQFPGLYSPATYARRSAPNRKGNLS